MGISFVVVRYPENAFLKKISFTHPNAVRSSEAFSLRYKAWSLALKVIYTRKPRTITTISVIYTEAL